MTIIDGKTITGDGNITVNSIDSTDLENIDLSGINTTGTNKLSLTGNSSMNTSTNPPNTTTTTDGNFTLLLTDENNIQSGQSVTVSSGSTIKGPASSFNGFIINGQGTSIITDLDQTATAGFIKY